MKPSVSFFKYIAQDFLFSFFLVSIAFEATPEFTRVALHLADRFADFIRFTANAKSLFISDGDSFFKIVFHDCKRKAVRQKWWNPTNGALLPFHVVN